MISALTCDIRVYETCVLGTVTPVAQSWPRFLAASDQTSTAKPAKAKPQADITHNAASTTRFKVTLVDEIMAFSQARSR